MYITAPIPVAPPNYRLPHTLVFWSNKFLEIVRAKVAFASACYAAYLSCSADACTALADPLPVSCARLVANSSPYCRRSSAAQQLKPSEVRPCLLRSCASTPVSPDLTLPTEVQGSEFHINSVISYTIARTAAQHDAVEEGRRLLQALDPDGSRQVDRLGDASTARSVATCGVRCFATFMLAVTLAIDDVVVPSLQVAPQR